MRGVYEMVKDEGAGVDRDRDVISAAWAGGRAVDGVVVASASIHRSLLAR